MGEISPTNWHFKKKKEKKGDFLGYHFGFS
jgi:hypothetical protein